MEAAPGWYLAPPVSKPNEEGEKKPSFGKLEPQLPLAKKTVTAKAVLVSVVAPLNFWHFPRKRHPVRLSIFKTTGLVAVVEINKWYLC